MSPSATAASIRASAELTIAVFSFALVLPSCFAAALTSALVLTRP
jgi:hypothetical protein